MATKNGISGRQWPWAWKESTAGVAGWAWGLNNATVAATPWFFLVYSKNKIEIASLHDVVWGVRPGQLTQAPTLRLIPGQETPSSSPRSTHLWSHIITTLHPRTFGPTTSSGTITTTPKFPVFPAPSSP
jgi:hypothetical protein